MNTIPQGYKDSKVGIIPEDWQEYSFENLFLFSTGKNIKQDEASTEFTIPCVRYGELYHMYNEVIDKVINKTNLDATELLFSNGDEILLPSAGEDPLDIGSASALTLKNIAIGRTINILRPKEKDIYSQNYVAYYINHLLKRKIASLAKGSSISNVYNTDLKKLRIALPSLQEQEKIAEILTTWDNAIGQQELLIKKKEHLKKGLMQKLLSGEKRFDEFDDVWEDVKLGDILYEPKKQKVTNPEQYELLTVKLHCKGIEKTGRKPNKTINGRPYYIVNSGELLVGRQNLHNGGFGVVKKGYDNYVTSNAISHFKEKYNKCNITFIQFYFSQYNFYKRLDYIIGGTGQKEISKSEFNNIKIKLPSLQEQNKISKVLSFADNEISLLQKELLELKKQKKGLIKNFLTGKVRVKV